MQKLLCAALAIAATLMIARAPCVAETIPAADSGSPAVQPTKQPVFVFKGVAPNRDEARGYSERMQKDQAAASALRAGNADDVAFIIFVVVVGAGVVVGLVYVGALIIPG